jgi:hypothetical protein
MSLRSAAEKSLLIHDGVKQLLVQIQDWLATLVSGHQTRTSGHHRKDFSAFGCEMTSHDFDYNAIGAMALNLGKIAQTLALW